MPAIALVVEAHPELAGVSWNGDGTPTRMMIDVGGRRFEVANGVVTELGATAAPAPRVITWPGDQTAVPLIRYAGDEFPDPLSSCPGFSSPAGLPLLLRRGVDTEVAQARVADAAGSAQVLCVLSAKTYVNRDPGTQAFVRSQLAEDGAVVIIPKRPLAWGQRYSVEVALADASIVRWSFAVSSDSSIGLPAGNALAGAPLPGVSSQMPVVKVVAKAGSKPKAAAAGAASATASKAKKP